MWSKNWLAEYWHSENRFLNAFNVVELGVKNNFAEIFSVATSQIFFVDRHTYNVYFANKKTAATIKYSSDV